VPATLGAFVLCHVSMSPGATAAACVVSCELVAGYVWLHVSAVLENPPPCPGAASASA